MAPKAKALTILLVLKDIGRDSKKQEFVWTIDEGDLPENAEGFKKQIHGKVSDDAIIAEMIREVKLYIPHRFDGLPPELASVEALWEKLMAVMNGKKTMSTVYSAKELENHPGVWKLKLDYEIVRKISIFATGLETIAPCLPPHGLAQRVAPTGIGLPRQPVGIAPFVEIEQNVGGSESSFKTKESPKLSLRDRKRIMEVCVRPFCAQDKENGQFFVNDEWQDDVGRKMAALKAVELCKEENIEFNGSVDADYMEMRSEISIMLSRENTRLQKLMDNKKKEDELKKAVDDATDWHKKYYTKYYKTMEIPPLFAKYFKEKQEQKPAKESTGPSSVESLEVDFPTKYKAPVPAKKVKAAGPTTTGVKPNPLSVVEGKGAKKDGKGEKENDKAEGGRPKRQRKRKNMDE